MSILILYNGLIRLLSLAILKHKTLLGGNVLPAKREQTMWSASLSMPLSSIISKLLEFIITSAYLLQNNN
jgi:hypothetical protein